MEPFRFSIPSQPRGIFAEPICHVRNRIASRAGLRPDGREAELQRSNAAPGAQKIAFGGELHRGGTRGMIGGDHLDGSVAERLPKLFVVFALTDRRSTLELGGGVGNFLGGESQIVRASFRSDGSLSAWAWRNRGSASEDETCTK